MENIEQSEIKNPFINYKKEKVKKSERADTISKIYDIYTSPTQRLIRKKENWKRYVKWCKMNKQPNSKESQAKFKKSKLYIKEHPVKTICYFISHIPTKDLYFLLSVGKDMENRNQNFSRYLINQTK